MVVCCEIRNSNAGTLMKLSSCSIILLWLSVLLLGTARDAAAEQVVKTGPIPGRFVVKVRPGVPREAVGQALTTHQYLRPLISVESAGQRAGSDELRRLYFFRTDDGSLTAAQIRLQLGPDNIEYVEPEYAIEFFDLPSDPLFPNQWYLHNTGQLYLAVDRYEGANNDTLVFRNGSAGNDAGMSFLYDNPIPASTGVVVAVVDTGVDPTHPDLQGRLWNNPDEIPDNGIDDDHNGYIDDIIGYDISGDTVSMYDIVGDSDPSDYFGHGTHIAGIIAAVQNQQGIAGLSQKAEIMAVKIRPNGTTPIGAMGIIYAVNAGANIINISWGTPFESLLLKDAVEFAHANGVLVSVAAGNTGDLRYMYPAAIPEVITVAAGDSRGYVTSFSTYGPHIDLCAPGKNILSLRASGTDMYADADEPQVHIVGADSLYYLADGTSMAAPMVAGAAAVIWSVRPQLTLEQLEADLLAGARDIVDPFATGDSLLGFDSLSGYGYLDVGRSLQIAHQGGLYFVTPAPRTRYVVQMPVKVAAVGDYTGGWSLFCATSDQPGNWQLLASGSTLPGDSVLCVVSGPEYNGPLTLKLVDGLEVSRYTTAVLVTATSLELTSPEPDVQYDYNIPIAGHVYGADYIKASISYRTFGGSRIPLLETGGEFFDSLIYSWNASGVNLGLCTVYLEGEFQSGTLTDSVTFLLSSAFAEGWPQNISGRGGLSPTATDLDKDGTKELIVGTTYGLNVFHSDGRQFEGFPALFGSTVRCIPAVYDTDRDGFDEIICCSDSAIHVFNSDGTYASGWPISTYLDSQDNWELKPLDLGSWGYGTPNPMITELDRDKDSAIVTLDQKGNIFAYTFDGDPYFYSKGGVFASYHHQPQTSLYFSGNGVSGADLDGDGLNELVFTYSANEIKAGVAVFEGRTGKPAFGETLPYVIKASGIFGTLLTDFDGDKLPEIVTSVYDSAGVPTIWVKTDGLSNFTGWPRRLPEVKNWLGSYPMAADLDLDGIPEIITTFYELDIGVLYIFRADGTPYRTMEGKPAGEVYRYAATFGVPVVANLIGDQYPEIVIRSGHIFPGSGRELVHILDHTGNPVPGWPIETPTDPNRVFSTPFAPMVDDVDGDGLVELILISEGLNVFVWDFEASYLDGKNSARIFGDNLNSSIYPGTGIVTDVDGENSTPLPRHFNLYQNYPNPFNPTTSITFELPSRTHVRLEVFNILGQRVGLLADQSLPGGSHTIGFDGSLLASGVYFYRVQTEHDEATRKMVLVK